MMDLQAMRAAAAIEREALLTGVIGQRLVLVSYSSDVVYFPQYG
jgi:hypothetical protein